MFIIENERELITIAGAGQQADVQEAEKIGEAVGKGIAEGLVCGATILTIAAICA